MTEFVSPHIRNVLKTYQDSATKSLQGPGSSLAIYSSAMKKEIYSPDGDESIIVPTFPPPEMPIPILSAADTGRGILYETILEGKPIGCFRLGGEMRLCFPQVLNNVLMDFGLDQINRIFDELRIFCSQCSLEQLNQFKAAKILPEDVNSSGLITRTNAERLCSALLHQPQRPRILKNAQSFKVIHRCFGKTEGICTPELYSQKDPHCIRCIKCNGMFSPQMFVCHVHQQQENSTLHWGFDSNNWRAYIQVAEDQDNREKYVKLLEEFKERDQQEMTSMPSTKQEDEHVKRKIEYDDTKGRILCKREPLDIPLKKARLIDEKYLADYQCQAMMLNQYRLQKYSFRPWTELGTPLSALGPTASSKYSSHLPYGAVSASGVSLPYFTQEPPMLQNPDRVVRYSDLEHFEQSYQPNVALAPRYSTKSTRPFSFSRNRKERDREYDASSHDREHVISINVKIKQERPQTPTEEPQSPEFQIETPIISTSYKSIPTPLSPDGKSGSSNEITSSTSPLPSVKRVHIADKITPPSADNSQLHHFLRRSHSKARISAALSRIKGTKRLSFNNDMPHSKTKSRTHQTTGEIVSEFELSTDTEDDSLVGDADSTNNIAPLDIAYEALKNTEPQERDKVISIIKMLLDENMRINNKNSELMQELQSKEEKIFHLLQMNSGNCYNTNDSAGSYLKNISGTSDCNEDVKEQQQCGQHAKNVDALAKIDFQSKQTHKESRTTIDESSSSSFSSSSSSLSSTSSSISTSTSTSSSFTSSTSLSSSSSSSNSISRSINETVRIPMRSRSRLRRKKKLRSKIERESTSKDRTSEKSLSKTTHKNKRSRSQSQTRSRSRSHSRSRSRSQSRTKVESDDAKDTNDKQIVQEVKEIKKEANDS